MSGYFQGLNTGKIASVNIPVYRHTRCWRVECPQLVRGVHWRTTRNRKKMAWLHRSRNSNAQHHGLTAKTTANRCKNKKLLHFVAIFCYSCALYIIHVHPLHPLQCQDQADNYQYRLPLNLKAFDEDIWEILKYWECRQSHQPVSGYCQCRSTLVKTSVLYSGTPSPRNFGKIEEQLLVFVH